MTSKTKECKCGGEECGESCGSSCDDSCGDSCNGTCAHAHGNQKGERLMEPDLDEETKKDIVEYQNLQQQIQMMMMQRQQALAAIAELDKAKEEVEKSAGGSGAGATLYRFIGNVVVPKKKDELLSDLKDEKVGLENRRDVFQKQEERLRKRFDELQRKLQAKLGGPQSGGSTGNENKQASSSGSGGSSGNGVKPKGKKAGAGDGAIFSG